MTAHSEMAPTGTDGPVAAEGDIRGPGAFTAILDTLTRRLAGGVDADVRSLAWRLWFTPWQMPPSPRVLAREQEWLRPTTPTTFRTPVGDLSGYTAGTGPTVLLLHGWGDHAARMGAFVEPLTRRGLRVIAFDLPAHGSSPGRTTDLYEVGTALDSVLGEEPAVGAVAHSMGGQALLRALATRDHELRTAALLAPAVRLESALRRFIELFELPEELGRALSEDFEAHFGPDVWEETDARRHAARVSIPVLLASDDEDEQVPLEDTEQLAAALPDVTWLRTSWLGHTRILRDDGVIAEVSEAIAEHALG
jgi:pimeloyl-ACP methyl ester carboxylesterase